VLDKNPASPKKGHSPHFSARVYCGETAEWIKMQLGTKVGVAPGDIVLNGDPAPPQKGTAPPQFSGHVCYGQMAGLIEVPLDTEVGLGPGDVVLMGSQLLLKMAQPPLFFPCLAKWLYGSRCHLVRK